jgi:ribonucleoside-diphosphate reductase alpha chain
MTARGLADGQGKARTNGEATSSRGKHPAGTNGHATATVKPAVVADKVADKNAAILERAGLKMAVDPSASPADRQSQFAKFQIDAPACDGCGSITVRNGNCYLCHNCGNSMGCS